VNWITLVVSVVIGLVVNEVFDISPWMARKVAVLAARVWTRDPELQATYLEEWPAVIEERPGRFSKLLTAALFLGAGLVIRAWNEVEDWAVLRRISLSPSLKPGYSRRHAAPPKWVPREKLPKRVTRLRQALWAAEDTSTVVETARVVAARTHCPRERGEALLVAAVGLLNIGHDHELAKTLERARRVLTYAHNPRRAAHLEVLAAMAAARTGEHRACLVALRRAVLNLADAEDNYETVFVWQDLAAVCSYVGLHEHAVRALRHTVALGRRLGVPDGHLANPGIHLRHALAFDHHGDTRTCIRLLHRLVDEYRRYQASGVLDRMRDTARSSYGYAMARLATLDRGLGGEAARLLAMGETCSRLGHELHVLGKACLAVAAGRPDEGLASLDPKTCDFLARLGRGEPHRVRALALRAAGDPENALVAEQQAREAFLAERARVQHARLVILSEPRSGKCCASTGRP
jgi:hypothetical protein